MKAMYDELFGEIRYEDFWVGRISLPLLSECYEVDLEIECYEGEEINKFQRDAFSALCLDKHLYMDRCLSSIFSYYQEVFSEYRERIGVGQRDTVAPVIHKRENLKNLINLRSLYIPEAGCEEGSLILGFVFSCSWEPEHGLGVKLVNGEAEEVGYQDVIL